VTAHHYSCVTQNPKHMHTILLTNSKKKWAHSKVNAAYTLCHVYYFYMFQSRYCSPQDMKYLLIYYTITFSVTLYFFFYWSWNGSLWDIRERKNMARRNWSPCMHSAWHWVMFFFRLPCLWWYYKTTWKWWQNRLFFLGPPLFIQRSQPTMAEKL
jgi:hypothetical protein